MRKVEAAAMNRVKPESRQQFRTATINRIRTTAHEDFAAGLGYHYHLRNILMPPDPYGVKEVKPMDGEGSGGE